MSKKVLMVSFLAILGLLILVMSTSVLEIQPIHGQMSSNEAQGLYASMEKTIEKEGKNMFFLNTMSKDEILDVFNAILLDHPEFMTLDRKFTMLSIGPFHRVTFSYHKVDVEAAFAAVENLANSFTGTDLEKIEGLYRYLTTNVSYRNTEFVDSTVYGALVNGVASCEGYSESMSMVLSAWGIENRLVSGEVNGEAHRWVRAKVNGAWWDFDPTFDKSNSVWKYFMVESAH